MAGIVVAMTGDSGAKDAVRRASQVLLRRPHHRLEEACDPAHGICLGFVGERGSVVSDDATGVIVALDGELVLDSGTFTGSEAARLVLDRYLQQGSEVEPPDGRFSAAVWDPGRRALTALTDRIGLRSLYAARQGRAFFLANELKALVAAGLEPRLDLQAWAEMIAYEHPLGEHTPLAGVRLLPGSATLTVLADGTERLVERWRYRIEAAAEGDERELVGEFGRLLRRAVVRRLHGPMGLALSGGLDSRCLATIVREEAPEMTAFTFGAAGSEELRLARQVARRAGLAHVVMPLEPGYIARGAAETVWLTEGQIRCFHAHHLTLQTLRSRHNLDAVLIGYGGDATVRWGSQTAAREIGYGGSEEALVDNFHTRSAVALSDDLVDELLTPAFAAEIRGRARASLAAHLAEEQGSADVRRLQFAVTQIFRRKIYPGVDLYTDDVACRDPFVDMEFVEFLRRMPDAMRLRGHLQCAYLRQFPTLARVRSPKDGIPPSLVGRRRKLAARTARSRVRAQKALAARLGPVVRNRRGQVDYAADLRAVGGPDLLAMLLERRTLAREQIREEPVRRLISETLSGQRRHTQTLGVLLTLELFQRQFLEGEVPEPASWREAQMTGANL